MQPGRSVPSPKKIDIFILIFHPLIRQPGDDDPFSFAGPFSGGENQVLPIVSAVVHFLDRHHHSLATMSECTV